MIKGKLMKSYLKTADILLEQGQYELALRELQQMLEKGEWDSDIIGRIYKDFILPDQEERQRVYARNCRDIPLLDYESCLIETIPLSDGTYLLFDAQERRFLGDFCAENFLPPKKLEKSFSSLLIADMWDIREILSYLWEKEYANIYIVLNDTIGKFMSFFKLHNIHNILPSNLRIFANTEDMLNYFSKFPDVYLPRKIISTDIKKYQEALDHIHTIRLQNGKASNNVFLSICIPSYNRGSSALRAVECALQMEYDSEIEIIVSNNGSTIGGPEYQAIQAMQDSRIRYYEFEENVGMALNIYNCLQKATGHYAVLFSDEDTLITGQMEPFLNYLYQARDLGCCIANGDRIVRKRYAGRFPKGAKAFRWAIRETTYITGCCYNMDHLRSRHLFDQLKPWRGNRFEMPFPHSVCAALLAKDSDVANTGMVLWHCGDTSVTGGNERIKSGKVLSFLTFDTIMGQEYDLMRFMEQEMPADFQELFLDEIERIFSCFLADEEQYADIVEYLQEKCGYAETHWIDVWLMHYKNCLKVLRELKLGRENQNTLLPAMDRIFLDWLDCRRIRKFCSEKENLKMTLRAQLAKYYWEHGVPFLEIDFAAIDEKLDAVIGELP